MTAGDTVLADQSDSKKSSDETSQPGRTANRAMSVDTKMGRLLEQGDYNRYADLWKNYQHNSAIPLI